MDCLDQTVQEKRDVNEYHDGAILQPDGGCVMYNGEDIKKQGKQ